MPIIPDSQSNVACATEVRYGSKTALPNVGWRGCFTPKSCCGHCAEAWRLRAARRHSRIARSTAIWERDIGSRRQLRLDECGAVVLAVAFVLVVLCRDEALNRETWLPLQHLLGGTLGRRCIAELRMAGRDK
jgi:hypothetical protein